MMLHAKTWVSAWVTMLTLTGCGRDLSSDLSETSYRIAAPSSAGLTWKAHQDKIRVCYSDRSNSETHKNDVIFSIAEWMRGIAGVASQPVVQNIEIVASNSSGCDVRVNVGNYNPAYTQLGYTPTVNINYSGWYGSRSVTLHEFGHAFGLLDTYSGRGGSCQTGQPDSVMCRASYSSLKQDDIGGVQDMYRRIRAAKGLMVADSLDGTVVE